MEKLVEKLAVFVLVLLMLIFGLIVAGGWASNQAESANYSKAVLSRAEAEAKAVKIAARAEARLDSAQATAILLIAAIPWAFMASIIVLAIAVIFRRPSIVERQIVYLPPPDQSRQETWRVVSSPSSVKQLQNPERSDISW